MGMSSEYTQPGPSRAEVDARSEPLVLEFGTPWCGYCQAAQPHIRNALEHHPGVAHIKVEDGPGRRLGRSFGVKLWPTLIFLKDGEEQARVVRPRGVEAVREGLEKIDTQ